MKWHKLQNLRTELAISETTGLKTILHITKKDFWMTSITPDSFLFFNHINRKLIGISYTTSMTFWRLDAALLKSCRRRFSSAFWSKRKSKGSFIIYKHHTLAQRIWRETSPTELYCSPWFTLKRHLFQNFFLNWCKLTWVSNARLNIMCAVSLPS